MKKYKVPIIITICCCLFVMIVSGTYYASYAAVYNATAKTLIFDGTANSTLAYYLINDAPKNGTSAVGGTAWNLVSDRTGEYRYVGTNPDNYISFNGELWRIIGVMPNMTYCTGTYGSNNECSTAANGSLVKIIRNGSLGSYILDYKQNTVGTSTTAYGSNEWTDSQIMLMLNGTNYLKRGYDSSNNALHGSYTITNNIVKGNGYNYYDASTSYIDGGNGDSTSVTIPSSATTSGYTASSGTVPRKILSAYFDRIATVKWNLRGTNSYATTVTNFYNLESSTGTVYTNAALPENRAVYWYGKIGLMYVSDYGYATNGGSTYNRAACLSAALSTWNTNQYKTDCAGTSWLWYNNITSTPPGTSGANWATITPLSNYAYRFFRVSSAGSLTYANTYQATNIRPTLYLKPDTPITGGTGTWNDPYTIYPTSFFGPTSYWYSTTCRVNTKCTFPSTGGATLQSSGSATGHDTYIGQGGNKYYTCISYDNTELCLSQPYTQYGLSGHTAGSNFTSNQQTSGLNALKALFANQGISVTCNANNLQISCYGGYGDVGYSCGIQYDGTIGCSNYDWKNLTFEYYTYVDASGNAYIDEG